MFTHFIILPVQSKAVSRIQIVGIDIFQVVEVFVVLIVAYVVTRIVSKSLEKLFMKTPFPENIETGIIKISKYVIYIIGLFVVISVIGFDVTSILVGLGAFSIAISFATSNIIQNLVSGILLLGDQAVKVGDEIKIQAYEGRVVKIGIRTTVMEDKNGDMVIIPNCLHHKPCNKEEKEKRKHQLIQAIFY